MRRMPQNPLHDQPESAGPGEKGLGQGTGEERRMTDSRPRCRHCNKLLAEKVTRPWRIRCPRCRETWDALVEEERENSPK